MPDNKLTDNEITIKALKELLEVMLSEGDSQRTSTISHTIYLINRLQAKVIKEQNKNSKLRNERNRLQAENEGLKVNIDKQKARIIDLSYKEFAKRLKEKVNVDEKDGLHYFYHKQIDNLLKELVGEDK